MICAWHSIVAFVAQTAWSKTEAAEVDKWVLIGFACAFALINLGFTLQLFLAYLKVLKIQAAEKQFIGSDKNDNKIRDVSV